MLYQFRTALSDDRNLVSEMWQDGVLNMSVQYMESRGEDGLFYADTYHYCAFCNGVPTTPPCVDCETVDVYYTCPPGTLSCS